MTRRSRLISGLGWVLVCGLGLTSVWSQTTRKPVGPPTDASRKKTAAPVADDPFSEPGPTTSVSPAGSDLKADPDDPDFAVIQPWLSSVVTIRWHEPQPGAPKLELKTQGGIVVDPRGYIVTLPFRNVDNGADDLNDPGTNGQERSIRVRFSAGTEYNAQLVDNEPHVLAILKVDLPRPCPSIDLTRVREPVDRERVFLVPQQLSQRTLMGRVTTISANFGDGTPPLVGCGMRIPKTDAGSLLVSEQGHPLGIVTVLTGKVPSYALPLESAKEYIGRRIAENEEDEQRRARRRPLPPEAPQRIDRTSGRDPLATESLPQWEQLAKHESQAAAHARVIRDLQTRKIPDGDSMLKENRRLLRDQLNQAFDLKAQIEERRLQEFRSRLDRLEQQIGQRKALRDKIVDRRATELIDGEAVHWNHPLPDESSLPPRDVPSEPAGETPFLPDGRLPPTDDLTLPTPRSPIGQPDNAPVDPLRARAPTAPPFEDVSPPIRSSATPHELVPFEEADAPAENAGTKLSVHLRPAVDPQGEPQA
ncbi:MAG: hypothetical protein JSS02_21135, partial [Planctomycetes bacterium]|nr:hypothetical protein [Planctomycetota bacterium]